MGKKKMDFLFKMVHLGVMSTGNCREPLSRFRGQYRTIKGMEGIKSSVRSKKGN